MIKNNLIKKLKKIIDENESLYLFDESFSSLKYHYILLKNENENTESYNMLIDEIKKDIRNFNYNNLKNIKI